jgi:hypothetical protein
MLPSIAKSAGWTPASCSRARWGMALLRPEQLLGLAGLDNLTHSLFWSLLANIGAVRGGVAVAAAVGAPRPARRCCSSTCSSAPRAATAGVLARPRQVADLLALAARFLGAERAHRLFERLRARQRRRADGRPHRRPDAQAGAVRRDAAGRRHRQRVGARDGGLGGGGRGAGLDDVLRILDASQLKPSAAPRRAALPPTSSSRAWTG